MKRASLVTAIAAVACLAAACGNDFTPKSEIDGLRVLAVRVDTPYAKPGTKPALDMLLVDESKRKTPPKVVWIHGCTNPKGDLYYECYPQLGERLAQAYGGQTHAIDADVDGLVTIGTKTTADVPADAITSRPPSPDGTFPQARVFVFFVACTGTVQYAPNDATARANGLPLRCIDEAGNDLGADDFVYGYTPIFVFDQLTNAHPIARGATIGGAPASLTSCGAGGAGGAAGACAPGYGCSNGRCLPVVAKCTSSNHSDCPHLDFKPLVDPASAEIDEIATILDKHETRESVWIEFAATNGRFETGARVINDPNTGWTDDFAGQFEAFDAEPGESQLYAIVRDNRGGQTWITTSVLVR